MKRAIGKHTWTGFYAVFADVCQVGNRSLGEIHVSTFGEKIGRLRHICLQSVLTKLCKATEALSATLVAALARRRAWSEHEAPGVWTR